MKTPAKKEYLTERVEKKILIMHHLLRVIILIMSGIVLYDSFYIDIPFYFILFFFGGRIIGRFYKYIIRIDHIEESNSFTITISRINIIITLLLIVIRFILGKWILDLMHIVQYADAIYLFFIGINYSKWRSIIVQLDNKVYQKLSKDEQ